MRTREQVALSVRQVENVAAQYRGTLDRVIGAMSQRVWVGSAATAFELELSGQRKRLQQILDQAVADAHHVLATTPPDAPPAPAVPAPMRSRPY